MSLYKRPDSKFWWMKFHFDGELVQASTKCSNKRDAGTVESAYRTQLALGKIGIEPKKDIPNFEKASESCKIDAIKRMEKAKLKVKAKAV